MPTEVQQLLAGNLKRLRTRLNMSQLDLATRCNLSPGYIGDMETCRKFPSDHVLQRICDALLVRPMVLFADEPSTTAAETAVYRSRIHSALNHLRDRVIWDIDQTFETLDDELDKL